MNKKIIFGREDVSDFFFSYFLGMGSTKILGFPLDSGKESTCQCRRCKRHGLDPWVRKIPWRRKWQPTPVFLPGESHERRSLVGYSPRGCKESDMTERLTLSLSLHRCSQPQRGARGLQNLALAFQFPARRQRPAFCPRFVLFPTL